MLFELSHVGLVIGRSEWLAEEIRGLAVFWDTQTEATTGSRHVFDLPMLAYNNDWHDSFHQPTVRLWWIFLGDIEGGASEE